MKRWLLPFAVGLVVGLAGWAGVALLTGEPEPLPTRLASALDSAVVDTATVVNGAEETAEADVEGDPAAAIPPDAAALVADGLALDMEPEPPGEAADRPAAAEPESMRSDRLARVFGSMQAREAARVMEHMDDYEVQVILGQLGNREAAAILSNLTPERAAVISRTVIRGERSTP